MPSRRSLLRLMVAAAMFPVARLPALAETPEEKRLRLFERLRDSATEQQGRAAEDAIWRMWMDSAPSLDIARAVDAAMDARESYDFDEALRLLDDVVTAAPGYAEGWNQRAFIRFLKDDLDGSLEDIEQALEMEPKHFAALAGKAMILMRQGRAELGQQALRQAVEIHPWLRERSMLIPAPGEVSPGPGRDI